ncbi:hypothetical protein VTN77DRAFT_3504 [Rasamsonia byssochlamydoides]|uniref:uncharacterized protein n=1 Tax=Rasamsonia byssochlamydoides TaxID=89139 RepID=UPI0037442942
MAPTGPLVDNRIQAVEEIIGYQFNDPAILREALQAAGFYSVTMPSRIDGNKNLALLGDAALKLVLVSDGYKQGAFKGIIGKVVSDTGSNENLANVGFQKKLDQFVYTNPSQGGVVSWRVMATTVEAILGAVFMDSAMDIHIVKQVTAVLGLSWPVNQALGSL